jgi:EAL domain-containing protein (putative c-di-GMP-specific phosphodiesterase class I)
LRELRRSRSRNRRGDLVPPGAFLGIAARFDLICEIDRWVLREAVRILHEEHGAGRDVALAVNHDPADQLVIEAVVNIARGLSTRTVAGFVGDDQAITLLRRLGVDYGQGFQLGHPRPIAELLPPAREGAGNT